MSFTILGIMLWKFLEILYMSFGILEYSEAADIVRAPDGYLSTN